MNSFTENTNATENANITLSSKRGYASDGEEKKSAKRSRTNSVSEPNQVHTLSWPSKDIRMLISRMREHIPSNDHFTHQSRAKLLPWNNIAFANYSGPECNQMWKLVLQRIRGFRLLSEMLFDAENWLEKPWTNFYASRKVNRHPDQPKQPPTLNALYVKENFSKFKMENPHLENTEIFKMCVDHCNAMSEKKKLKYLKKINIMKENYDREMEIFLKEHPEQSTKNREKKKKPKKMSAFNLYLENELAKRKEKGDDQPLKVLNSKIRIKWNNLKESKKLPWISKAQELEKEIYGTVIRNDLKSLLTKEEKKISDKAKGKPEKPVSNGYSLFSKLLLTSGELNEYPPKERMNQISIRWKALPQEEKKKLQEQIAEEKNIYSKKLAEYYKKYPEERNEITDDKVRKLLKEVSKKPIIQTSSSDEEDFKITKKEADLPSLVNGEKKAKSPKSEPELVEKIQLEEPKCPPSDAIKYFAKMMKKQKIKFDSDEALNEAWINLPKKERKSYKKAHVLAMEQYEINFNSFLESMSPKKKAKYLKSKEMN